MFFESLEPRQFLSHSRVAPPAAPSNLFVAPGGSAPFFRLTWTDNSSKASQVLVEQKKGSSGALQIVATLPPTATYYRTGYLREASIYTYEIVAVNRGGVSGSETDSALTWSPGEFVIDGNFASGGNQLFDGFDPASQIAASPNQSVAYIYALERQPGFIVVPTIIAVSTNGDGSVSFGSNGQLAVNTILPNGFGSVAGLAVQPNGKIIVAGNTLVSGGSLVIARLNADGSLDTTFGSNGETVVSPGSSEQATSMVVAPNGSIYLAGISGNGSEIFAAHFSEGGAIDEDYGDNGFVEGDQQPAPVGYGYEGYRFVDAEAAYDVVDGNIVMAASVGPVDRNGQESNSAVVGARLLSSGTFTDTFSYSDGTSSLGVSPLDVWVDSAGKIVVSVSDNEEAKLLRFDADGTTDTSWVGPGVIVPSSQSYETSSAFGSIIQLSDGSYAVAGYILGGGETAFIAHLNASNGSVIGGLESDQVPAHSYAEFDVLAQLPDGSVFAVGGAGISTADSSLLLARYAM